MQDKSFQSFFLISFFGFFGTIWKANQLVVFPSAPGLPTAMESWSRIEVGAGIDDVVGALQLHVCDKNFKWKSLRSPLDKWFKLSRYVWKMFKTEPGPQTKLRSQWRRHARIGAMLFCPLCMPNGKWQGVANGAESIRWRRMKLERHYCKSLALFISNLSASVPRLRLKCQPPVCPPVHLSTDSVRYFLMQFTWHTHKSPQDWPAGEGPVASPSQWGQVRPPVNSIID